VLSLGQDKRTEKRDQESGRAHPLRSASCRRHGCWSLIRPQEGEEIEAPILCAHAYTHVARTIGCDAQLLTGRRHMFVFKIYMYRYIYGAHTCCWVLTGQRKQQGGGNV
jgi:hypothetical protein